LHSDAQAPEFAPLTQVILEIERQGTIGWIAGKCETLGGQPTQKGVDACLLYAQRIASGIMVPGETSADGTDSKHTSMVFPKRISATDPESAQDPQTYSCGAHALADDANLLDQLQRSVQISVLDCICREDREFCYFATFTFAEVSLGAWLVSVR
jgi:hypothetical protein